MKHWICIFSLTLILFAGLTGCINLGPDYQRPDLNIEIPESYENDQTEPAANPVIADRWWQDFGDAELNVLVEEVLKRPDIRAAEARLEALTQRIGSAKAARFPAITLTGNYGWNSDETNGLFKSDSLIWNFSRGVVQPLMDAGRLKARQRGVEAQYEQAVSDYADTVLNAFAEVEGALLIRKKQLERRQRELRFLEEARATQRVAQNRYLRGLVVYLDVLDAQQTRFTAEDNLALVDLNILTNRVNLHRALGGSWAVPEPIVVKGDGPFFEFKTKDTTVE